MVLDQTGETVHLKVSKELLMEEWVGVSSQNIEEIHSENIEEVFSTLQERALNINYKATKKETKDGARDNWVQTWSPL